jgi:O-antigen biosynthesis protein
MNRAKQYQKTNQNFGMLHMLDWTGERFIPGVGAEIAYEHYGRYLLASRFVDSKRILDIPCGEGFGSFLLAQRACAVIGMDIDENSLNHARARYHDSVLNFQWADMTKDLPFPDGSFDIITCFEGIEHIGQKGQYKAINEFKRLLASNGMLLISTPNKLLYTDAKDQHNPYHIHEFYAKEFQELLSHVFPYITLLGQMSITGGLIASLDDRLSKSAREMGVDFVSPFDQDAIHPLWTDPEKWMYLIAICVNEPSTLVPRVVSHLVVDPKRSSISEFLDNARQQLAAEHLADKNSALAQKDVTLAAQDQTLAQLHTTLQEHVAALAQKDVTLAAQDQTLAQLHTTLQEHVAALAQKDVTLAAQDQTLAQLHTTLQEHVAALNQANSDLAIQRFALEDRDRLIAAYEAERRTFGSQIGRWLSRQRNAWAPPTSPQGRGLGLMIRTARIVHGQGVFPLIRKAIRASLHRGHLQRWPAVDWLHISGLFDAVYYLSTYPDVATLHMDPAKHYVSFGWKEGRNPHALFDTSFYLEHNPDVAQAGLNPLVHYVHHGVQEGRDPSPTFCTQAYLNAYPDVARSGANPLLHYLRFDQGDNQQLLPSTLNSIDTVRKNSSHKAPWRVLFLSGEPDTPGHIYRVERYVRALHAAGFDASWVRIDELSEMINDGIRAHALVIWRAVWSNVVAQAVAAARQAGAIIVFDVDDYMIDPELARVELIDGIRSQGLSEDAVADCYSQMQRTMLTADYCTCPTIPLAKALRVFGKPTFVLPNGFDENTFTVSRRARVAWSTGLADKLIRIGYVAGTRTHQKDFAQAAAAVARILREYPECRLVLFKGSFQDVSKPTLDLDEFSEFFGLEAQIEWRHCVPLEQLPQEMARLDVSLVPLEVGNVYCEAKSELKFFEAALAGVPTVASPTVPLRAAIRHGITGFLAITQHEWYNSLKRLVTQPDLRDRMAREALHDVLWTFGPERRSESAASAFEQMLHTGRTAARLFQLNVFRPRAERVSLPNVPEFDLVFQSRRRNLSAVAVVVPLYNYAHYIQEALESVREQTLQDKDLIVVEDQSTDHSLAVAQRWLEQNHACFNHAVLLQNRTNSGLGLTRNVGFSLSEARFILPLDADNKLLPNCLQRCLKEIERTGAAVAYPIIQRFGDDDGLMGEWEWTPSRFTCGNYIDAMALIRKAAWVAVGGYDHVRWLRGWEDYDLWCKFVEHGFWGIQVAEKLALYRVHPSSMLRTQTEVLENKRQLLENIHRRYPWLDIPQCTSPA